MKDACSTSRDNSSPPQSMLIIDELGFVYPDPPPGRNVLFPRPSHESGTQKLDNWLRPQTSSSKNNRQLNRREGRRTLKQTRNKLQSGVQGTKVALAALAWVKRPSPSWLSRFEVHPASQIHAWKRALVGRSPGAICHQSEIPGESQGSSD